LALTLGFERIGGTLFGSAKRLDSGLVGCGWFDDFSYSHQVFSFALPIIFTTSFAGFVASLIEVSNLSVRRNKFSELTVQIEVSIRVADSQSLNNEVEAFYVSLMSSVFVWNKNPPR